MKAVILVGGEGTRLRPLTCNTPKAMVPILNRPFLEHLIDYLKRHEVKDVILAMGYIPGPIQSYFGDGGQFGVRITYLVEQSPLGTGGAVKNAEPLLTEPFLALNGDILAEIDLTAMIARHNEMKPKVSIALTPVDNPTLYGVVETRADGRVRKFVEKPRRAEVRTNMINAGIYIMEPEVLAHIPPSTHSMLERHLFPLLLEMGECILGYPSNAYWIDIGTPEKYLEAHHDLLRTKGIADVPTRSQIDPAARIEGAALIGEDCVIGAHASIKGTVLGPGCHVGKNAIIEGAVLWQSTQVGERAILRNCMVGSNVIVEEDCQIADECVLGDGVTVQRGSKLAPGSRVWPDGCV